MNRSDPMSPGDGTQLMKRDIFSYIRMGEQRQTVGSELSALFSQNHSSLLFRKIEGEFVLYGFS